MSGPTTTARILVVEDEPAFAELVTLWLERHGWHPMVAGDGLSAISVWEEERPDLVLLDLGLPGIDGWEVLDRIRAHSTVPVLLVTARGSDVDKVRGLGYGADDYITKPVSFPELMARVQAALRRAQEWSRPAAGEDHELRADGLVIDLRGHRVLAEGHPVHLTQTEFRLLCHLVERPDEVVTHAELLTSVWGPGYRDDVHVLQATMRNLRAKLAAAAPDRRYISTVYGQGYRLGPPDEVGSG